MHSLIQKIMMIAILLLSVIMLASCGFGVWVSALFGSKVTANISINQKVNQDNPIQVDILLIYDELLQKQLTAMTAQEWFDKRREIRNNYPKGHGFDVWEYEWTPGQNVGNIELPIKVKAVGALVFANYFSPGPHRLPMDPYSDINLIFQEKDFSIEPVK